MGPSPITYFEIDAYQRLTFAGLSAWQVALIRQLDDALLAVFQRNTSKPGVDEPPAEVPVTDARALKGMFRSLAASRTAKP